MTYCDCQDYCEWCRPELVYPELYTKKEKKVTNDFRDELIKWLECRLKKSKNVYEQYTYREVIAFIKTEGKLK